MKTENVVIEKLNELFQKRGYVSEEEIFELCDEHSLSFLMTDHVINKLTDMGVLIADAPENKADNDYYDYSQIDYEQVYIFFEKLYPDMRPTLDYIRAIPPIQKGETKNLISQIRSGNEYARKVLIEKCFRTALRITMSYQEKTTVPLEDLFMASYDGISEAIDSYDPYSGSHFTSYVSLWIKQKIDRYICDNDNLIRLPVHMFEQISNVKSIIEDGYNSRKALLSTIVEDMEISEDRAEELLSILHMQNIQSLDDLSETDEIYVYAPDEYEEVLNSMLKEQLMKMLDDLSEKQKNIIFLRYGIGAERPYTLEEIGSMMNVTRERVRQIEDKTLRRIREFGARKYSHLKLLFS